MKTFFLTRWSFGLGMLLLLSPAPDEVPPETETRCPETRCHLLG